MRLNTNYDTTLAPTAKTKICIGWKDQPVCKSKLTGKADRCHDCKYEHEKMLQRDYANRRKAKAEAQGHPAAGQAPGGGASERPVPLRLRPDSIGEAEDQHPHGPSARTAAA